MFDLNFYRGKKVFITGHTGFKGAWLCKLLSGAGAVVTGVWPQAAHRAVVVWACGYFAGCGFRDRGHP